MNIEFAWFIGVVEDRLDPLKLGRCRVRILGKHTEDKQKIPTEQLPWAWPMMPVSSASVNGIGQTPLGIVEGSWVVGFFRDGLDSQEPVIMGSIPGLPIEYPFPKNQSTGFLDPRTDLSKKPRKLKKKEYPNDGNGARLEEEIPTPPTGQLFPKKTNPFGNEIFEVDTNRLARNDEKIVDTIVAIKKSQRDMKIPVASGLPWDEPETPYDSSYPYNHVYESESGHVFEVDDTRGGERLHIYHRSGTFSEIYPDGIKVEKIVGNSYRIVMEEEYVHNQNRVNITIDGPFNVLVRNSAKIVVTSNCDIDIGGNLNINVGGNYHLKVDGQITMESGSSAELKSTNTTIGAGGTVALKGARVTSNPAISQSLETMKASSLGVVIPATPSPQSGSGPGLESDALPRDYPKPIGPYTVIKEDI